MNLKNADDKALLEQLRQQCDEEAIWEFISRLRRHENLFDDALLLLEDQDERIAGAGSLALAEVPPLPRYVYERARKQLHHESPIVRFNLVECVLLSAGRQDHDDALAVLQMICDTSAAVRGAAMSFGAFCDEPLLRGALRSVCRSDCYNIHARGIASLLLCGDDMRAHFAEHAKSQEVVLRRYAAMAAARARHGDTAMLKSLVLSEDSDIATFAADVLERCTEPSLLNTIKRVVPRG